MPMEVSHHAEMVVFISLCLPGCDILIFSLSIHIKTQNFARNQKHLEDPAGQGTRLLTYMYGLAVELLGNHQMAPDERALNQPRPHPSSKTV